MGNCACPHCPQQMPKRKPEPRRTILRTAADVHKVQTYLSNLDLEHSATLEVTIKPYELTRSQAQNRLYRKWVSILHDETGQPTDSLHLLCKERFLIPILADADAALQTRVEAVKQLRRDGRNDLADFAKGIILDYVSTSALTVPQFKEFLNRIEEFALEYGITLSQHN